MTAPVDSEARSGASAVATAAPVAPARAAGEIRSVLHRVAVRGGRMAVREYLRDEDFDVRRPSLVLLHGFTGSSASWAAAASRLVDTFRVLCPDLPGHGDSEFENIASACTMEGAVSALSEALGKLSVDSFSLAGYSLGGRVALHCALADSTRISALILESASPGIADETERGERCEADEALAAFIESSPIEAFVDRWEQLPVLASQAALPATVRAEVRAGRLACSKPGLAASLRGMGAGAQAWLGGRLRRIHVPTLLVSGRKDDKFTKISAFMDAHIPDSVRRVVDGAGHSVHLEAPGALAAEIIAFAGPRGPEADSQRNDRGAGDR